MRSRKGIRVIEVTKVNNGGVERLCECALILVCRREVKIATTRLISGSETPVLVTVLVTVLVIVRVGSVGCTQESQFTPLYNSDRGGCHWFAHKVGQG
jgi:hypothetical protein